MSLVIVLSRVVLVSSIFMSTTMVHAEASAPVAITSPSITPGAGAMPPGSSAAASDGVAGKRGAIADGTVITMENWREYREFMPDGMAAFFEGKYFWKMPPDVQMPVGPP